MQNFNTKEFLDCGVYMIINTSNSKSYIGSTTMTFKKRLNHHRSLLRVGKHKNRHLQNSWSKYGESSFVFEILEITNKVNALEREQFYMDLLKPEYNINPLASGTPNMLPETIEKRTYTFTDTIRTSMNLYYKIKEGEITIDSVPDKYRKLVESRLTAIPWNKGMRGMDCSYLKGVSKTKTDKVLQSNKENSERIRENSPNVFVYDIENNFLGEWRSSKDLEEWSMTELNNLPIKSRFNKGNLRRPIKFLASANIMKIFNTNMTYKGLYFKSSLTTS